MNSNEKNVDVKLFKMPILENVPKSKKLANLQIVRPKFINWIEFSKNSWNVQEIFQKYRHKPNDFGQQL